MDSDSAYRQVEGHAATAGGPAILTREEVEAFTADEYGPTVNQLAQGWLALKDEVDNLSRFVLTRYPQDPALTQPFVPALLPESVVTRFGQAVLEALWRRISQESRPVDVNIETPPKLETPG